MLLDNQKYYFLDHKYGGFFGLYGRYSFLIEVAYFLKYSLSLYKMHFINIYLIKEVFCDLMGHKPLNAFLNGLNNLYLHTISSVQ